MIDPKIQGYEMSKGDVDNSTLTTTQPDAALDEIPRASIFSGWERYPESLPTFNPFACDATSLRSRLVDQSSFLFAPSFESRCHIRISDINASDHSLVAKNFVQQAEVEQYVERRAEPDFRLISIARPDSLSQLSISRELLQKLFHAHQIGTCGLDLVSMFTAGNDLSEKGHSLWGSPTKSAGGHEICYTLRYMVNKASKHIPNWTERQLGIYHRFGSSTKAVMMLLQTGLGTDLESRLNDILKNEQSARDSLADPLLLHLKVLSTYLDNWRSYLQTPARYCRAKEDKYMTTQLADMDSSLDFDELQELRHFQSKLIVANAILRATVDIICAIKNVAESEQPSTEPVVIDRAQVDGNSMSDFNTALVADIESLRLKCQSYFRSTEVLQLRIQSLMKLLSDGLSIQNQQTSSDIADATLELTQKSVEDNAIVRVITVITLIYLPLQGVATFFGMNLTFTADDNTMRFTDNWWLFIECAFPITAMTLGVLLCAMLWERASKKKKLGQKQGSKHLIVGKGG